MRLLSLDYEFVYGDAEYDEFASDHSLMDYDVVIWDPVGSMHTYIGDYGVEQYRGRPDFTITIDTRERYPYKFTK